MKAYFIAAETMKDEAVFAAYRKESPATLAAFGGKFVVRGGHLTTLEGEWPHPRLVTLSFLRVPPPRVGTGRRSIRKSCR